MIEYKQQSNDNSKEAAQTEIKIDLTPEEMHEICKAATEKALKEAKAKRRQLKKPIEEMTLKELVIEYEARTKQGKKAAK